jgi:uncharacterized protein YbjT (DUF2867 family)
VYQNGRHIKTYLYNLTEEVDMNTVQNITLILGGTGKTGRRVAQRLLASGYPVRVGSRSGNPPFDWQDQETWASVLRDVDSVYMTYYPDLAIPGAEDIADVAVAVLTEDGHAGQLYELTGPRLLTFAEAIEEIARATGRQIRYLQVSANEYASTLAEQGVPGDFVWLLNYLFTTVLDGLNAYLTDGVQRALGRSPRDFNDYVREAAASGVWGGVSA